jgi:Protein of unknown function (DUF1203)
MTNTGFQIHALPAELLDDVRAGAYDRPVERLVAEGGEPLRCCLRDARAGEEALLFGYEPPLPDSPYREAGAVFAHAGPCAGPDAGDVYPPDWRGRAQVLRAYDRRGWIHDATRIHDGTDPEGVIAATLADPEVVLIHSRNIAWGCYMFAVTR